MRTFVLLAALAIAPASLHAAEHKHHDVAVKSDRAQQGQHQTTGVIRKVDRERGSVTIAHDPVKSLGWPAMSMPFKVEDKTAFDRLAEGKKIEFQFEQRGRDYVITGVR